MKRSAFLFCCVLFTGTFASTTTPPFAQIFAQTVPSSEQLLVQADEASVEPSVASDTLKVGTKEIVPFVSLEDENKPYGYSIEFWERVAGDLG